MRPRWNRDPAKTTKIRDALPHNGFSSNRDPDAPWWGERSAFPIAPWRRPFCVWRSIELQYAVTMSKTVLRAIALLLFLAALASWLAAGANRGWTKTSVPVKRTDEVTGITVDDYQKRFVPGIDFLGAALLGSAILAGASFLVRNQQPQPLS